MIRLILIMVAQFVANSLFAQNLKEDLLKMYKAHNSSILYTKIISTNKDLNNPKNPIIKQQMELFKNNNNYFYWIDNNQMMLANETMIVMLDKKEKIIMYQYRDKNTQSPNLSTLLGASQIDSILQKNEKIEYKGTSDLGKHYVITNSKKNVYRVDIHIDPNTFFLKKMTYFLKQELYKEHAEITVFFENLNAKKELASDFFSEKKYIVKKGKDFYPAVGYEKFKVLTIPHQ